ncbi:MAG: 6-bladed beta-propeller [Geobacteraceae bacterium]|nr:6-bladed beta-propeller [Geobacteraceae bacterium]NTW79652.1 6-bladed beta-propeller [Geobacteraceae bacterium]
MSPCPGRPLLVLLAWLLASILMLGAAGCAVTPESHQMVTLDKIVWPPPPMEARISWVKSIVTPADAGIRKGFWRKFADAVFGETQVRIVRPYGIHVDLKKRIIIADTGGQVVHFIDPASGRYELVRGSGESGFKSPVGVTGDADGRVYVTDSAAGKIYRFSPDDLKVMPFISGLQRPTGIVYSPMTELVYVSDTLAGQVVAFTTDGEESFRFGTAGENAGQFNHPTDLAVDGLGRIFVTDALNVRVQTFSGKGAYMKSFGKHGDSSGNFAKPKGISIDSEGHMHISDALFDVIQIFDEDGQFLLSYGNRGSGNGELWMPSGIFIRDDMIYVADTYNNRIQIFQYLPEMTGK